MLRVLLYREHCDSEPSAAVKLAFELTFRRRGCLHDSGDERQHEENPTGFHRCQPSRNRAGNPANLVLSRIPAYIPKHPAFLCFFGEKKKRRKLRYFCAAKAFCEHSALRQWRRHLAVRAATWRHLACKMRLLRLREPTNERLVRVLLKNGTANLCEYYQRKDSEERGS